MNIHTKAMILLLGFSFLAFQLPHLPTEEGDSLELAKGYLTELSSYGFFDGPIANMDPAKNVIPYTLNTPLFSDYAQKLRFIRFPDGGHANYHPNQVMDFADGTAIIKTFYYYKDERFPKKGRRLMETRVLLKEKGEWTALPYIWNEDQTEAYLEVAGGRQEVQWRDQNGKKKKVEYVIPNMIQCKECHWRDKALVPIGPTARQLNRDFAFDSGSHNQLEYLAEKGYLTGLPDPAARPQLAAWDDHSMPLNDRARAYLDANCGHCHNPLGPANTSGMFLHAQAADHAQLGVNKPPIAAGKGSGGRKYGIVPGNADASILVYRMETVDPGMMMPEIGRKLQHEEGVALIKEWINAM